MVLDEKPSESWILVSRSNFPNLIKTGHAHLCQHCNQLLGENGCAIRTEDHDLDLVRATSGLCATAQEYYFLSRGLGLQK